MKIIVNKESDIPDLFKESVHIMAHLRYYTKLFQEGHDAVTKERRQFWEVKADELLTRLSPDKYPSSKKVGEVKIEIENHDNNT